ncbi:hypothetical protein [Meiothermus ruber]|uniref:Mu-like prophage FluMu N-terminal domain-containing protein n=1 Tax=Meiothermus ruber (strain ATCC 35948 / DSM 1279 / VKM B-1258 / 21) TaxID=504728 RepID=D3PTD4_MEIRD|nr:hypothetical protein [Meiothermus ruber]ADD28717.1 hypothetical protein Mrub_1961 [Meiothermus ruber DSM 1279]AGK05836.1 hypothetical protein K649_12750 [Meiothermus ruber DSM 1279]
MYRVKVSTPQRRGRWRIGRQWWPEPQEALVSAEELARLQADSLLRVEILASEAPEEAPEPKAARPKRRK